MPRRRKWVPLEIALPAVAHSASRSTPPPRPPTPDAATAERELQLRRAPHHRRNLHEHHLDELCFLIQQQKDDLESLKLRQTLREFAGPRGCYKSLALRETLGALVATYQTRLEQVTRELEPYAERQQLIFRRLNYDLYWLKFCDTDWTGVLDLDHYIEYCDLWASDTEVDMVYAQALLHLRLPEERHKLKPLILDTVEGLREAYALLVQRRERVLRRFRRFTKEFQLLRTVSQALWSNTGYDVSLIDQDVERLRKRIQEAPKIIEDEIFVLILLSRTI